MGGTSIRPNLWRIAALTSVAAVLGSIPYLVFVGAIWLLPVPAVVGALAGLIPARRLHARASVEPAAGEWLTAFWGLVGRFSLTGMALLFHGMTYGALHLVAWLLGLIGVGFGASTIATISLFVSAFMALASLGAACQEAVALPARLYPRVAGVKSAYHAAWQLYGAWILAAAIVGPVLATIVLWLDLSAWYWVGGLAACLFYSGFPIAELGEKREKERSHGIRAVRRLLEATGWEVKGVPATGDPEIDPILEDIDLLARRHEQALAIEVQAMEVGWTVASGLRMAARVLESELTKSEQPSIAIRPLLVLAGATMPQSLRSFAEAEKFQVVEIPAPRLSEVGLARDDETMRRLAREILRVEGGDDG